MTERSRAARIATAGWEVILLDLGAIHAPLSWVFPHAGEDERAWLPSNGLLCRRGEDAVLVDCGLGPYADVFELEIRHVDLADALTSSGCAAELISAVVLTHLDVDHIGGVVAGEPGRSLRPSFPRTRVAVLEPGLDVLEGRVTDCSELAETIGGTLREAGIRIALATRRALVEELAGSSTIVACSHVDGFGRIERRRDGAPVWGDVA